MGTLFQAFISKKAAKDTNGVFYIRIEDTDREMEMFKRFKEYSKEHPNTSYDEFIKETM